MDIDIGEDKEVVKEIGEVKKEDAGVSKRVSDSGGSRCVDSDAGSAVLSNGGVAVCVMFVAGVSPMLLAALSAIATVEKIIINYDINLIICCNQHI